MQSERDDDKEDMNFHFFSFLFPLFSRATELDFVSVFVPHSVNNGSVITLFNFLYTIYQHAQMPSNPSYFTTETVQSHQ